jgi:uncharacterized protein with HEPN domain
MRSDTARIGDMLEALEKIRLLTALGRADFFSEIKVHESVAFELLKLGEASGHVSSDFKRAHPDVPWKRLMKQRNQLVHEYFRVDLDDVWEFVSREMDPLERFLRAAARESR